MEGLKFLVANGAIPDSLWPTNAIDRKCATPANIARGLDFRVKRWIECRPRNINELMSMLLRRTPGAGGFNWWGHEVSLIDALWLDGAPAMRIRNQWITWNGAQQFGFGILRGSKMLPDDMVFVQSSMTTAV